MSFCKRFVANTKESLIIQNGISNDRAIIEILRHGYNSNLIYDLNNYTNISDGGFTFLSIQPHKTQIYGYSSIVIDNEYIEKDFINYITEFNNSLMFRNLKELHIGENTANSDVIMNEWKKTLHNDCVIKVVLDPVII